MPTVQATGDIIGIPDPEKGKQGVTPYPQGSWSASERYERTEYTAPYVEFLGEYYILNKEGISPVPYSRTDGMSIANPKVDYEQHGNQAWWVRFDKFKYLFVEVLLAEFGKIGSAVFANNKLISQFGIDGTRNYHNYGSGWIPRLMLDFITGAGHLANKNIEWDENGNIIIRGKFESNKAGRRVVITPEARSILLYDAFNRLIGKFETIGDGDNINDDAGSKLELSHYYQGYKISAININSISGRMSFTNYSSNGSIIKRGEYTIDGYKKTV